MVQMNQDFSVWQISTPLDVHVFQLNNFVIKIKHVTQFQLGYIFYVRIFVYKVYVWNPCIEVSYNMVGAAVAMYIFTSMDKSCIALPSAKKFKKKIIPNSVIHISHNHNDKTMNVWCTLISFDKLALS